MLLGSHVEYIVAAGDTTLVLRDMNGELLPEGAELTAWLDPERAHVFPANEGDGRAAS